MPFFPAYNTFTAPVTFAGPTTFNKPITMNSDPSVATAILTLHGTTGEPLKQYLQTFDSFGNPISTLPNAGGDSILGDRRSAFPPGDIFNAAWQTMTATSDNIVTNAAGFRLGHGTSQGTCIFVGTGLPTAANPVSTGMPPNGSFYFRADGGAGTSVYMARAGAWAAIL